MPPHLPPPQMIKGFDKAVTGLSVGETKKVTVEPEDAYGAVDASKVLVIPVSKAGGAELEPGMQVGSTRQQRASPAVSCACHSSHTRSCMWKPATA